MGLECSKNGQNMVKKCQNHYSKLLVAFLIVYSNFLVKIYWGASQGFIWDYLHYCVIMLRLPSRKKWSKRAKKWLKTTKNVICGLLGIGLFVWSTFLIKTIEKHHILSSETIYTIVWSCWGSLAAEKLLKSGSKSYQNWQNMYFEATSSFVWSYQN